MALAYHYETALAVNDSEGTDGGNTVGGAVVTAFTPSGDVAMLYDDESGTNGSTAKQTKTSGTEVGTVEFWIEEGTYDIYMNGVYKRRVIVNREGITGVIKSYATTAEIEALEPTATGAIIENQERGNAKYVLAASGYTALTGDLTSANGRVWALVTGSSARAEWFGIISSDSVDQSALINGASERMKGGELIFSKGTYVASGITLYAQTSYACDTFVGAEFYSPSGSSDPVFVSDSWVNNKSEYDSDITIKNILVDGSNGEELEGAIVELFIYTSIIENFKVFNVKGDGIALRSQNSNASFAADCYGNKLNTIVTRDCTGNGVSSYNDSTNSFSNRDLKIYDLRAGRNGGYGFFSQRSVGLQLTDSIIWGNKSGNIMVLDFSGGDISDCQLEVANVVQEDGEWYNLYAEQSDWASCISCIQFVTVDVTSTADLYHLGVRVPPSRQGSGALSCSGLSFSNYGGLNITAIDIIDDDISRDNLKISGSTYGPNIAVNHDMRFDDASLMMDFEPTISFETPGDLSVNYSVQSGKYVVNGNKIFVSINVQFDVTYTTASGKFRINGLPYDLSSQLITQGSFTPLISNVDLPDTASFVAATGYASSGFLELIAVKDSLAHSVLDVTSFPSGGTVYRVLVAGEFLID